MSGFVTNARHDRHFAISEIVEIDGGKARESGFGRYHTAKLRDGTSIFLDQYEADQILEHVTAVIPALPGYYTVDTGRYSDSGDPWITREPVICWQLLISGEMRPVTIRGPNNGETHNVAVEQPSGEVWMPVNDAIYPTFEAFQEAEFERQEHEESERAARIAARLAEKEQGK